MPTVFNSYLGIPVFRHPLQGSDEVEKQPNASGLQKSARRAEGTFSRSKIEFRNDENLPAFSKPVIRPSMAATPAVIYAQRADRNSLLLLGVAVIVLVMMAMALMFRPGGKHSFLGTRVTGAIPQVQTRSSTAVDDVDTPSLEAKMQEERAVQHQSISKNVPADTDGDGSEMEVSLQDQRSSMDEKISIARAKHQENERTQPQAAAVSKDTPSAWTEPEIIGGVSLPTRIYDDMAHPEPVALIKKDAPSRK